MVGGGLSGYALTPVMGPKTRQRSGVSGQRCLLEQRPGGGRPKTDPIFPAWYISRLRDGQIDCQIALGRIGLPVPAASQDNVMVKSIARWRW